MGNGFKNEVVHKTSTIHLYIINISVGTHRYTYPYVLIGVLIVLTYPCKNATYLKRFYLLVFSSLGT